MIDNAYTLKNTYSKSVIEDTKKRKLAYDKWRDERDKHNNLMMALFIVLLAYITLVFLCEGYGLSACF